MLAVLVARRTVVKFASRKSKCMPFAGQLSCSLAKALRKSTQKSIQNRCRGGPRGTQNRVKFELGRLSGRPVALKSVPKASWEHLGSVSERPWRAPKASGGFPRAARDAREDAQERPGARRSNQNRRSVASGSARREFFRHGAFAKHCRSVVSPFFIDFRFFRNVCDPSEVPRLPAKSRVRLFAL